MIFGEMRSAHMDLRNNKITLGEILKNPKGEGILGRFFPELMNPFLLHQAKKMSLENILKLATGPNALEKKAKIIDRLNAI
jgi:hypothetical protein